MKKEVKKAAQLTEAKFLTYEERISRSPEEMLSQEKQYQIEDAKDQLDADIKATRRALSKAERNLDPLYSAFPLDTQAIFAAEDNVKALKAGLERLNDLSSKLFG